MSYSKTFLAVIEVAITDIENTPTLSDLAGFIDASIQELQSRETGSESYVYRDITVYETVADLEADITRGLTVIGETGFCSGYGD